MLSIYRKDKEITHKLPFPKDMILPKGILIPKLTQSREVHRKANINSNTISKDIKANILIIRS